MSLIGKPVKTDAKTASSDFCCPPPKKFLLENPSSRCILNYARSSAIDLRFLCSYWEELFKMATNFLEPSIITHPRPKRSLLGHQPSKKRKIEHKIEEINFDTSSREEYLTGFHKRKVARAKQAQAEAAKKAKEERIVIRKQVR